VRASVFAAVFALGACSGSDTITVDLQVSDLRDPDDVFVGSAKLDPDTDENDQPVFIFVGTFECPFDPLVVRSVKDEATLITYTYQPFCACDNATGALTREHADLEIGTDNIGTVASGTCFYEREPQ